MNGRVSGVAGCLIPANYDESHLNCARWYRDNRTVWMAMHIETFIAERSEVGSRCF
jgi:hypothetical protein